MNNKRKVQIGIVVIGILLIFILVPQVRDPVLHNLGVVANITSGNGNAKDVSTNIGTNILFFIGIVIFIAIMILFGPIIQRKLDILGIRAALGSGKDKMFSVEQMRQSAVDYIREFGVDSWARAAKGNDLYVSAQFVDSTTSDTPYGAFLLTTEPIKLDMQNKLENIGRHKRWFIFVDRRTNECTYIPDVDTWVVMFEIMDRLRAHALPLEKKKSMTDKYTEAMLMGQAAGAKPDAGKEKEDDKNETKKD
jgi:hypothetical protein